jgi:hypothetical protein
MGVCLEIAEDEFIKENINIIDPNLLRDIEYFNWQGEVTEHKNINIDKLLSEGDELYLKEKFRKEHLNYLFFTKDYDWKNENERRLLHFSNSSENEYCSITNSLKAIYLGVDFHKSYLPAIQQLCPNTEITPLKYREFRLGPLSLEKFKNSK